MNSERVMLFAVAAIVVLMLLTGCDRPSDKVEPVRVVEVNTPVLEFRKPPAELFRSPLPADQIPVFVGPTHPSATSCVSAEGEGRLRTLIIGREAKLDGWEAFNAMMEGKTWELFSQ